MSRNLIGYLTSYDLDFGKEPFLAALYIAYKILVMLLIDPAKKISFNHNISDGDLVIVYEKHDNMKAVKACEISVLQNCFDVFKHLDWIGKPFGLKVFSNKSRFVYLLAPTLELWTLVLCHRTQILYVADISFVIMYLELVYGCLVLESGTESGSLTTSLTRVVALTGHVYTRLIFTNKGLPHLGREDFERTGLSNVVIVRVRDIQCVRGFLMIFVEG
ncbi:hypothetical protein HYC85_000072 [Camellia sinensis]|uniref:tRNA (adenine(58)-N(1))-methyltransferase n=1 Tax=Camellia sinensis TaxID=4442 RepID=A0A7J7FS52_CAMSI|nr:hypothetical protein HYC85_000072 [Camellia sinensis]